ncbi:MAG TPA: DUF1415 domain-containing protein [Rubrivivax sp.]|nr:DUF1415 domain-containing protein [Rubrivivax sp.]
MDAAEAALRATRAWVEQAVIGLNLCPFAKAVQVKGLVRWVCSQARDTATLLAALRAELLRLHDTPIEAIETTLLVHPWVLTDFMNYNDFLDEADALLRELDLEGTLQIAGFHPHYRFAGTDADDIANATNRSPHPTLHLLREASIERAVAAFPEPEAIYEANMRTLRDLGPSGWAALQARCLRDAHRGGG